ncbi:NAD(P)H-hydrate dehydratase [Actinoallomurus spadix]|uniref:Bifunctional NAD(P)H-hydrate repair enzyme n=1 Tax=Actinoallomurus spadix TaxID=79912 RepID=A0ABN0WBN8_9ACTN|nr:NAD(P)H-hydrate dehydratase [Actinoallomurus spadix]MCO5990421.1 NAD(P)H-hydrate dehydratase [Actinoallomurus spadix]
MRYAHEVDKVRTAERALMARLPDGTLMSRAAAGLASVCARILRGGRPHAEPGLGVYGARVVLLVGGGDNGGDALYAGAGLARRGAGVTAVLAGTKSHEGGLADLRAAGGRVLPVAEEERVATAIDRADLIIDGMLGIGGRGGLREPYAGLARRAADSPAIVVACDLPSGVDASSGQVAGAAVRADVTVTFGTYKPGLLVDPGAEHAGVVELVDIGLGPYLPDPDVCAPLAEDVAVRLPRPTSESNKYRRGVVGVLAGSETFTGAAVLAVGGAVRGGAGMVRFASSEHPVELVRQRWPESVTTVIGDSLDGIGRVQAWVAGPGLGTDERAEALLAQVLATDLPVLVDADGLTVLARRRDLLWRDAPTVLTPHAGELARLLGTDAGEIEARRLEHVRRAAEELTATVLLKGSTTLIAEADRPVRVNPTGTPWLATAGSGDVLSGLTGALLAGGVPAIDAAATGAYLHGLAARLSADPYGDGAAPISAYDVLDALPEAFRTLAG